MLKNTPHSCEYNRDAFVIMENGISHYFNARLGKDKQMQSCCRCEGRKEGKRTDLEIFCIKTQCAWIVFEYGEKERIKNFQYPPGEYIHLSKLDFSSICPFKYKERNTLVREQLLGLEHGSETSRTFRKLWQTDWAGNL